MLHAQVKVFEIDIEIRKDQLFADHFPDDAGHLIAVHFNDGILYFDFGHEGFCLKRVGGLGSAGEEFEAEFKYSKSMQATGIAGSMKVKQRRAFPGIFALKRALMLEVDYLGPRRTRAC
jgi:hypothetical protein